MSAIKRILFPVDFSFDCKSLIPTVRRMVETWDAEVTLLHVIEAREWLGRKHELGRLMAQMREIAGDGLRAPYVGCRLERGAAGERILEFVRAKRIDLVVMPAGGCLSAYGKPLGSVADQVISEAPCAVWIDWGSARSRATSGMFARRVCCALELNDFDDFVLNTAAQVTEELDAALTVVHPVPAATSRPPVRLWEPADRDRRLAHARNRVEVLKTRFFPTAEVNVEVGSGHSVVSRSIQLRNAGLLVTPNWREVILAAESRCPVLRLATPASMAACVLEMPLQYLVARRSA